MRVHCSRLQASIPILLVGCLAQGWASGLRYCDGRPPSCLTAGKLALVITAACGWIATLGETQHGGIVTIAPLGGTCTISSGSCTMFFFFGNLTLAPYSVSLLTRILVIVLPAFSLIGHPEPTPPPSLDLTILSQPLSQPLHPSWTSTSLISHPDADGPDADGFFHC